MRKFLLCVLALPLFVCSLVSNDVTRAGKPVRLLTSKALPTAGVICHVQTGVDAGLLNLRAGPGMSFALVSTMGEGDQVALLEGNAVNGWFYVQSHSYNGWVNSNYIDCEVGNE